MYMRCTLYLGECGQHQVIKIDKLAKKQIISDVLKSLDFESSQVGIFKVCRSGVDLRTFRSIFSLWMCEC